MWPEDFWPDSYWETNFWPKEGAEPPTPGTGGVVAVGLGHRKTFSGEASELGGGSW